MQGNSAGYDQFVHGLVTQQNGSVRKQIRASKNKKGCPAGSPDNSEISQQKRQPWAAATIFCSSPVWNSSVMMSQPPTNCPLI